MNYLLIRSDEDGNPIRFLTEEQVQEMLDEQTNHVLPEARMRFRTSLPEGQDADPNYWDSREGLLLRVEVVVPRPVETVVRYEI